MDKVVKVLEEDGWKDIKLIGDKLVGVKNDREVYGKICEEFIDFRENMEYVMIPYEDDFLIYKISGSE